jgi:hypothetical protein
LAFVYPAGARVHSLAVLGPLWRHLHIAESQVRPTPDGIDVAIRATGPVDFDSLNVELEGVLRNAGVADPKVTVWTADRLARVWSGKLRRFVPLGSDAPAPGAE